MPTIAPEILAALRKADTPTVCNALEHVMGGRTAEGFTKTPVVCADVHAKKIDSESAADEQTLGAPTLLIRMSPPECFPNRRWQATCLRVIGCPKEIPSAPSLRQ